MPIDDRLGLVVIDGWLLCAPPLSPPYGAFGPYLWVAGAVVVTGHGVHVPDAEVDVLVLHAAGFAVAFVPSVHN